MFRRFRHRELKRLAKRMIKFRGNWYTFIDHGSEPNHNNAEREIRPAVLMRKTSYGNRSDARADNQAILMSMIRTCHKQNLNFVNFATNHLRR
jgi:transposase